jgi:hypothetical protein
MDECVPTEPGASVAKSSVSPQPERNRWLKRIFKYATIGLSLWLLLAYVIAPLLWRHYEHQPSLEETPKISHTSIGIPGDPLNIGFVGDEHEVTSAFLAAGWYPADPITLKTSLHIAESSVLNRPYPTAPVSNLFVFDRRQDLAFERPSTRGPEQRHHVRLWRTDVSTKEQGTYWLGAATYDHSVGLSHRTGQITHHIGPNIDAERDQVIHDLTRAGHVESTYQVTGVGPTINGRNGGGDRYFTDGELTVAELTIAGQAGPQNVTIAPNPPAVRLKNRFWARLRGWLE